MRKLFAGIVLAIGFQLALAGCGEIAQPEVAPQVTPVSQVAPATQVAPIPKVDSAAPSTLQQSKPTATQSTAKEVEDTEELVPVEQTSDLSCDPCEDNRKLCCYNNGRCRAVIC